MRHCDIVGIAVLQWEGDWQASVDRMGCLGCEQCCTVRVLVVIGDCVDPDRSLVCLYGRGGCVERIGSEVVVQYFIQSVFARY